MPSPSPATELHALVVEDERLARLDLVTLLRASGRVANIVEAADLTAAIDAIRATDANKPDVVFLDIQLGDENGFDLLPHLDRDCRVVFVTAHDTHAVRAFAVNA